MIALVVPQIVLAAWWNPFSWFESESESAIAIKKIDERDNATDNRYVCGFDSQQDWNKCMIDQVDRASAEREWKQRKLETMNDKEVNVSYMGSGLPLAGEQKKIRKWRIGFEAYRDSYCKASNAFIYGSGTPGMIAQCELGFELHAIKDLDFLYYNVIIDGQGSAGIKDFEPAETDIDALIKTNITVWPCDWGKDGPCG